MKRLTLAVILLVLGVSAAFADGPGMPPPPGKTKPPAVRIVR
jgi:hypothetical protein